MGGAGGGSSTGAGSQLLGSDATAVSFFVFSAALAFDFCFFDFPMVRWKSLLSFSEEISLASADLFFFTR